MKERIIEFLRAENKTSAQFAEDIGVQPLGISHILSGRYKPSVDFILKMLEKYIFLSTEWLLFGKGTMYKEQIIPDLFNQPLERQIFPDMELAGKPVDIKRTTHNAEEPEILELDDQRTVEKIVWFYNNNSFKEYYPEKE